jgi:Transcriptional activator of glycolytic enzymes
LVKEFSSWRNSRELVCSVAIVSGSLLLLMLVGVAGVSKDEKDIRGRWKGKGRVSDVYDDVELPYPDCKVAEKLAMGGPCFYIINSRICDVTAMTTFILSNVVPNIRRQLPDSTAIVLGKAVLWLCFSSHANEFVSAEYSGRLKTECVEAGIVGPESENPILKVQIIISGDQGTVYMDELPMVGVDDQVAAVPGNNPDGGDRAGGAVAAVGAAPRNSDVVGNRLLDGHGRSGDQMRNWMLAVQSGIHSLRRENVEIKGAMASLSTTVERGFSIVNGNIRRLGNRPGTRVVNARLEDKRPHAGGLDALVQAAAVGADGARPGALPMTNATLMPTPRSLHDLWQEYMHGVGGRKPARHFSHTERGRVRHKYHRRKIVWDLIAGLVRQGHTADTAIDIIYAVYGGQTSVTNIINGLKRDKKSGALSPNLRV